MSVELFIQEIAKYVKQYAPKYNIIVYSPIIAQAILESASGTSELAVQANNFFGLKYNPKQPNRCPGAIGFYVKRGSEQNPDGSYVSSVMNWQKFPNMEQGVKGYFDFLNYSSRYNNLKNVPDPYQYLVNIKADGYATSLKYVDNVYSVITKYNLTQYDNNVKPEPPSPQPKPMGYTNSDMVVYTNISPNKNSPRNHKIDTITIHHMAGNMLIENCCNMFANPARHGSCNYCVGTDGRVGMSVEEKDRSWCSSSYENDHRAITIEVANDGGAPDWHVSDKALETTIELCVDICRRNGIPRLNYTGDKSGNLTMHKWFTATACPGPYLGSKFPYIAAEVNKRLGSAPVPPQPKPDPEPEPIIPPSGNIQVGDVIELKPGATYISGKKIPGWVFNKILYARRISSNGDITFSYLTSGPVTGTIHSDQLKNATTSPYLVKITAQALNIRRGPGTNYPITGVIRDHGIYTIVNTQGNWGKLKSGVGWISLKYTHKV